MPSTRATSPCRSRRRVTEGGDRETAVAAHHVDTPCTRGWPAVPESCAYSECGCAEAGATRASQSMVGQRAVSRYDGDYEPSQPRHGRRSVSRCRRHSPCARAIEHDDVLLRATYRPGTAREAGGRLAWCSDRDAFVRCECVERPTSGEALPAIRQHWPRVEFGDDADCGSSTATNVSSLSTKRVRSMINRA